MNSWWKHSDKCNRDFHLTSKYGISMTVFSPTIILSQAKPQLRSVSMLKLYCGDLATLETVSGCDISPMDKQGEQPGRGILG